MKYKKSKMSLTKNKRHLNEHLFSPFETIVENL